MKPSCPISVFTAAALLALPSCGLHAKMRGKTLVEPESEVVEPVVTKPKPKPARIKVPKAEEPSSPGPAVTSELVFDDPDVAQDLPSSSDLVDGKESASVGEDKTLIISPE